MPEHVTAEQLRDILDYNVSTGVFTWRYGATGNGYSGSVAGNIRPKGYLCIRIHQRLYMAHRLAWLYVHGILPTKQIDHINQNKSDNRISNLREANTSENLQNRTRPKANNKCGYLGVQKKGKKWIATIGLGGKIKYIGCFSKPEDAHSAYVAIKREMHPFSTL